MVQRITIKIEREPIVTRRTPSDPQPSPELLIQVKDSGNLVDGLEKAIRLLTSERDAIIEKMPIVTKSRMVEGDEEDEEELD